MKKLFGVVWVVALSLALMGAGQYGGTWKREGTVVSPHDDVTVVSFGSASTVISVGDAATLQGNDSTYHLTRSNHAGDLPSDAYGNISGTTVTTTGDITAGGFINGLTSFGSLVDDNEGLGVTYDLTTSFQTYTSFDTVLNSSDMTLVAGDGTITLGASSGGVYNIEGDISVTAGGGVELEFALFRNDTTELGTFTRGISGTHFHPPILINLTSDNGGAAYNTYSSISLLEFADSDSIWIDESTTGTHPLIFDMTFNDSVLYPTVVEFHGVLYDGSSAHEIEALMWNYSSSAWVDMRGETKDFPDSAGTEPFRYYSREFEVPAPISQYVKVADRESRVRMDHTSTGLPGHQVRIDKVHIHDLHGSAAISVTNFFNIPGGSSLSIKVRSDAELPVYFSNMHFHVTKVSD